MSARLSATGGMMPTKDEHISSFVEPLRRWLIAAFDRLLEDLERRRELMALAQMDERSLKDIGLTRPDAEWIAR